MGRRIGSFRSSFQQYRPVIDDDLFKEEIDQYDNNKHEAHRQDICVNFKQALPPDPLKKADYRKQSRHSDRQISEHFTDRIKDLVYTDRFDKETVDSGEADFCSFRSDCLYIHSSDKNGKEYRQC